MEVHHGHATMDDAEHFKLLLDFAIGSMHRRYACLLFQDGIACALQQCLELLNRGIPCAACNEWMDLIRLRLMAGECAHLQVSRRCCTSSQARAASRCAASI